MDKTGTLTIGRPAVTDVVAFEGAGEDEALRLAASLERRSEHPLAEGIVRAAEDRRLQLEEPRDFAVYPGEGVAGRIDGMAVQCGTERFMARVGVAGIYAHAENKDTEDASDASQDSSARHRPGSFR